MPEYKAPLRDMQFVLYELLDANNHYARCGHEEATREMVTAILDEAAKFTQEVIAPLNQVGDQQGCTWHDGDVTTPTGFKEAYQQYVEGGWPTLTQPEKFGGQGMPGSLQMAVSEMTSAANHSFTMYSGLSHGAQATLLAHGTEQQQQTFMPKLVEGRWTGTMCLTESHCGSDLGLLKTRASRNDDGSYRLNGTKIFISAGDHDLSDNIVHLAIARVEGAPEGTRGISLFIVPKFRVTDDGATGERNGVTCGSIEHKMGINANATCVINFDDAEGYLIGEENKGLNCMFTFMNSARVAVALEGVAAADASFQGAVNYARDRLQMRSLSGPKCPDKPADPIIVHPDVRRMLLTQKAFSEGGRALAYYLSQLVDLTESENIDDEETARAQLLLGLLTPIAKGFLTEVGFESANHGIQVLGGHGFIAEWGMEQLARDARICCLYEGTTGIQALDLLARKIMGNQGKSLQLFCQEMLETCASIDSQSALNRHASELTTLIAEWQQLNQSIAQRAAGNADEIGAASVDHLMYSGYLVLGYFWLRMATVAEQQLAQGATETDFYQAKLKTCDFYFDRILPRTRTLAATCQTTADSLMAIDEAQFLL